MKKKEAEDICAEVKNKLKESQERQAEHEKKCEHIKKEYETIEHVHSESVREMESQKKEFEGLENREVELKVLLDPPAEPGICFVTFALGPRCALGSVLASMRTRHDFPTFLWE